MSWAKDFAAALIAYLFEQLSVSLSNFANSVFDAAISLVVGVPVPINAGKPFVLDNATNQPWSAILQPLYWDAIVPLALGLQFLCVAYLSIRYQSLPSHRRKRVGLRLLIAFASLFFWLPIASGVGQLVDAIGHTILTVNVSESDIINWLRTLNGVAYTGAFGILFQLLILYVLLRSLFIYIGRYLGIIILTLLMPIIATLWAFPIWPANKFESTASRAAGMYPALLVAGIPPAVFFNIGAQVDLTPLPSDVGWLVILIIVWAAAKSQKYLMLQGSEAVVNISQDIRQKAAAPAKGAEEMGWAAGGLAAYSAVGPAGSAAVGGTRRASKTARPSSTPDDGHPVHHETTKTKADRGQTPPSKPDRRTPPTSTTDRQPSSPSTEASDRDGGPDPGVPDATTSAPNDGDSTPDLDDLIELSESDRERLFNVN